MATLIDGKAVAEDVVEKVKAASARLISETGVTPGIAVVIVGEDPASQVYVASKSRKAKECHFHSVQHSLPDTTTETDLLTLIGKLNADDAIHGILVQLPLPKHIDTGKVIQTIAPDKDVDGFHFINVGKLGAGEIDSAFVPCTPAGSMLLIERIRGRDLSGLCEIAGGLEVGGVHPYLRVSLLCHHRTRCRCVGAAAACGAAEPTANRWLPGAG